MPTARAPDQTDVQGFGSRVWRFEVSRLRDQGLESRVESRVESEDFRVMGFGFRVLGLGSGITGGFWVWGLEF